MSFVSITEASVFKLLIKGVNIINTVNSAKAQRSGNMFIQNDEETFVCD